MDSRVQAVIDRVSAEAARHDAAEADRLRRWRVLERAAGQCLWALALTGNAQRVLEIGTSQGVSTLWLADAVGATGGRVTSVDADSDAQRAAAANLREAGVLDRVKLVASDGGEALAETADGAVDLLFLDAERTEYASWWPHPYRVLRPGGLLVVDNALSHPDEVAPLQALLEREPELRTLTLEVGKGELVAVRR